MPISLEHPVGDVTPRNVTMERRLLLPTEGKQIKGRWGGGLMKRLFRRKGKKTTQGVPSALDSRSNEEPVANRYLSTSKDGFEEFDHTTVNLSYSGGSNPYSTDESYEADKKRFSRKHSASTQPTATRCSDVSFSSEPTSTSILNDGASSRKSDTYFAQLDVPTMQKQSNSREISAEKEFSNCDSHDESFASTPFVFHTRSALDQSQVIEDSYPIGSSSEHGMEVVLFDQDVDNVENGIFMSFQSPDEDDDDEWCNPFNTQVMDSLDVSKVSDLVPSPPEIDFHVDFPISEEKAQIPPSPALSQHSETSVTWVSHDDDGDCRPMKEIIFPSLGQPHTAKDDLFLDCDSGQHDDEEEAILEPLTPRNNSNRESMLDQFEPINRNVHDTELVAEISFLNSLSLSSTRSAFPNNTTPPHETSEFSPRRIQSDALNSTPPFKSNDSHSMEFQAPHSSRSKKQSPFLQKTPSSAFLKRKSAFTGEDLLSQEAESFAEFLEEVEGLATESFPSPITSKGKVSPKLPHRQLTNVNQKSAEERFLNALTESIDGSETEEEDENNIVNGLTEELIEATEALVAKTMSIVETGSLIQPKDEIAALSQRSKQQAGTSQSIDVSYTGIAAVQSYGTTRTSSTAMFSKSLSDGEDADDEEELTNNASNSYASSTSYAQSTLPGSRSDVLKYSRRSRSSGVPQLPYCGVFGHIEVEEEEEEDDDDDELSFHSEDVSENQLRRRRSNRSNTRVETPLLDQVRNELLETVQDLAREGSSVVMSFLRPRP